MADFEDVFAYRNQTKLLIMHIYRKLLEQGRFEKISISDIVKEAGISRATFYRYFQDKYDLFFQWISDFSRQYIDEADSYQAAIIHNFEYGYQERNFLRRIIVDNKDLYFSARYIEYSEKFVTDILREVTGQVEFSYAQQSAVSFLVAGSIQIWGKWISGGCLQPPEMVAAQVMACMPAELKKYEYFREH